MAVYQKALSLLYVDELLQVLKDEFCTHHYRPGVLNYKPAFDDTFNRLMKACEANADQAKRGPVPGQRPVAASRVRGEAHN